MRNETVMVTLALMTASIPAVAQDFRFTGTATTDNGSVIYEERHAVNGTCEDGIFRPQQHEVAYHKPDSEESFASKALEYDASVLRPTVDFYQPTFDEKMEITYPEPETLVINWQTPRGESERFEVAYPSNTVVDAGFDNFVRQNWQSVVAGEPVEFRFLGPTRGEHYGFVLERVKNDRVDADHVVQIRPTGMVLRFLVDPIVLGYSDSGALSDYLGLTNIRKNQDENYTAHIRYSVETSPDCELTP
ncbi:hypothetical protein KEHDKFFH_14895 [Marinobacter maroccanus]|uniref:Uncharacterized protein n=1 Tax=Marinobacter maroccanus TaxID=2055143 RepID=A0A2S5Z7B5_9GAMM|nr:hypothetical protein [Marinobacter maroccanus]PPI83257.1 hypothetical protein KEHDKFFH_14895 [Marinobacter maroccanus]